jgi:tetratricopeptide (TPR) repeat protein
MPLEPELDHYLQAYRLHQGLSKGASAEIQSLLRLTTAKALENGRVLPRAYGLQSFTILNAWLSDWIDEKGRKQLVADSIADIQAVTDARKLPIEPLDALKTLDGGGSIDPLVRTIVRGYAATAAALDGDDYENRWSQATADLYALNFTEAFKGYAAAQELAGAKGTPGVSRSSLAVDYADALFFAGSPDLNEEDDGYRGAIVKAIETTHAAIKQNPHDPKRHRWNWTLGWAHLELGGYADSAENYARSLDILQRIRKPHHLIRKCLIAANAALGLAESAKRLADKFMDEHPGYTLAVEDRWPYRNPAQRDRWKRHLAKAGLPA